MGDLLGPASVQYNDFSGTSAFDGHGGPSDTGVLEAVGLDPKEYVAVGFQVGQAEGAAYGEVYTIRWSELEGVDGVPGLAEKQGGAITVETHVMEPEAVETFLDGFKRWSAFASFKGVALREG